MKLALVINTVKKNSDLWSMFFDQLRTNCNFELFSNKYVFVDENDGTIPSDYSVYLYDKEKSYRDQFSSCIDKVKEEFCLYISEDYILYDKVDEDAISQFTSVLANREDILFIRLHKGISNGFDIPFGGHRDLYLVDKRLPYFYSQVATLWRTRDLEKIHKESPNLHIGNTDWQNSFEWNANAIALSMNKIGLYSYKGESKRGLYHYDSFVFPYIATALVKGKWNTSEYSKELLPLIEKYGLSTQKRGEC